MDPYELYEASGTCTVTRRNGLDLTAKEILDSILKAKEELYNEPPLIKVWEGPEHMRIEPLSDYPLIRENPLLYDKACFIVAGIGVICGRFAYNIIWERGFLAVWTDEPPDKQER